MVCWQVGLSLCRKHLPVLSAYLQNTLVAFSAHGQGNLKCQRLMNRITRTETFSKFATLLISPPCLVRLNVPGQQASRNRSTASPGTLVISVQLTIFSTEVETVQSICLALGLQQTYERMHSKSGRPYRRQRGLHRR